MVWVYFLAAYLIGSIPTALIVGKIAFNIDIRDHGSNNPGATNTLRVLGKKAAVIVLLIDVAKGALAASIPGILNLPIDSLVIGLIAVVGHCFPVFAGFRGGKAIATTAGVLLVSNIWMFLVAYSAFFLVILISKYVFMGSISVGVALLIYSFIENNLDHVMIFFIFLIFLIFLHRSNINNFRSHIEPKINDKSLKKDRLDSKKKIL